LGKSSWDPRSGGVKVLLHTISSTCRAWGMACAQPRYHFRNVRTFSVQSSTQYSKNGYKQESGKSGSLRYGTIWRTRLDHLATLQVHSILQYLLCHLLCGDHTGQLIRMIIEYTQLECGTMENILEQDYNKFSKYIINKNWITEIWQH
jgi:hypothetical protein